MTAGLVGEVSDGLSAQARVSDATVPAVRDTGFRHGDHTSLGCTECHSMEGDHGALTFEVPTGCASCHHGTATDADCAACHARSDREGTRFVRQENLTLAEGVRRTRRLGFDHARHSDLACRDCHTDLQAPRAEPAGCVTCHREHHALDVSCVTCHADPPESVHDVERAHATCAGSGCHGPGTPAGEAWSRSLCLACHQELTDHQRGAPCAECHAVPPREAVEPVGRTWGSNP